MKYVIAVALAIAVAGCSGGRDEAAKVSLEFRFVEQDFAEGLTEMTMSAESGSQVLYAHDEVVMGNSHVESANVMEWQGRPVVELTLTESGGRVFAELTGKNVGRRLGIVVDGKLLCAPRINTEIRGAKAIINGDFSREEAERMAAGIVE